MLSTSTRVNWDHKIPMGGQPTPWTYKHPTRTSQGTGPHMDSRVHDVLHLVTSRFHIRGHLHQHDDLFHKLSGLGSYSIGGWLLHAHPPGRGGHGFWLGPPSALHQWLYTFLCLYSELSSFSNCSSLATLLNCFIWHSCPICLYTLHLC